MKFNFVILGACCTTLLAYFFFWYDSSPDSNARALERGLACAPSTEGALARIGIRTERAGGELIIINVASGSISAGMGLRSGDELLLISSRGVNSVADADSLYVRGERTAIVFERAGTTHFVEVPEFPCPLGSEPTVD